MPQLSQNPMFSPRFCVLAGLIVFAVASRLLYFFAPGALPPNFTPVESIALFGGACFADRRLAYLVPLAAMLLADLIIGLHALLPVVYACVALTVLLGGQLRGRASAGNVAAFSVLSATLFFLVTNFFVWLTSGMYPLTGAGLGACFIAAVPFYKWTVLGTLAWSGVLFGGFALLQKRFPTLQRASA